MPDAKTIQVPGDYDSLVPWFNLIRRARSVTVGGRAGILVLRVLVDEDGKPGTWVVPELVRLEPSSTLEETLSRVFDSLSGSV